MKKTSLAFLLLLPGMLAAQTASEKLIGKKTPIVADSLKKKPSTNLPKPPKDAVQFFAADSAVFFLGDSTKINLFGKARLDHESGTLNANKVSLNTGINVMEAKGASENDSLGKPVLKRETDEIKSSRILYNYKTGKGKFEAARVNISEGALQGAQVKRAEEHVVYVADGVYSTCTLDHPHFYIRAKRMKVVNEEEIFFTRARLYLLDIPYPLILPFGYVPAKWEQKRSGLLAPIFQNQAIASRGYGLTNLGWFQYFNDYLTGVFSAGLYTSGTWNSDVKLNYRNSDRYSGGLQLGYSYEQGLEETDLNFSRRVNRSFALTHTQTISPWSNVNANINLRTSDYFKRNSTNLQQLAEQTATSRGGWNFSDPDGRYSLSANMQQTQNFQTNRVDLSGPALSFSLRRLTPFKPKKSNPNARVPFYESLSIGYSSNLQSNFSFQPVGADSATVSWWDALLDQDLYRAENDYTKNNTTRHINAGFVQRVSIDSKLLPGQFLQLNGNASANEYWYPETIKKTWNPETKKVETEAVGGFAAARDYQLGLNFNTTLYGISNRKMGRFSGFRHTMRPTMGFSWRPDFSKEQFGYFDQIQTDSAGTSFQTYSRFEGSTIGNPSAGESQSLSLSINNTFETRITRRDTTGEQRTDVIRLIDNFSLSTNYNFAADKFKLSDLSTSLTSNILRSIRMNAGANFTFYQSDSAGNRIDQYLISSQRNPLRMTSFNFNMGTNFSEGSLNPALDVLYNPQYYDPLNQNEFSTIDQALNRRQFVRWDIPWSVAINFAYNWNRSNPNVTTKSAVLNFSDMRFLLTPKWQVSTSLGYDFVQKQLTPPNFSVNRNLHCWDLSIQIAPYGQYKYFLFQLNVNSGQFKNLFQKLPGLNSLNQSSGRNSRF